MFFGAAHAYGPTGHRIVGAIASAQLCAAAAAQVEALLGDETLADAGLWADRIRRDQAWRHTAPWHYVNVDDDAPIESASGGEKGDVLQALQRFRREIADASLPAEGRAEALRFFTHFVADIHQPLHVGRAEDRGGNSIRAVVEGKRSNLHQLWDAQALLRADRRDRDYLVADQAGEIRRRALERDDALWRAPLLDWAAESQALRPAVYAGVPRPGAAAFEPDAAYLEAAREITLSRLGSAAMRLAAVLNEAWCGPPQAPAASISH